MIKFEVVLAHSRPAAKVSLDPSGEVRLNPKPQTEPELGYPADHVASVVNSSETTQEPESGLSMTDNNQDLLSSAVGRFVESALETKKNNTSDDAKEDSYTETETAEESTFSTQPRCWAGVETTANLILPDRYVKDVLVVQQRLDWHSAAQWIFVSPPLTTSLFHATRNLRSFGLTPLLYNPCSSSVPFYL
jgi:hypothetical protein